MSFFIHFFMLFAVLFGTTVFASVGKVSLLKGEATLQREAQKTPLKNGAILEEKDILLTAKNSQVQLIFEDKTVITLGEESEFKIEEYFNDASKPKAKFKFGEGSFKSITGQIGKTAPENFTLETKTATIGIRGTTIQGNVGKGGDTIACLSGTITVRAIGAPNFIVVPAGKSTFVAPGNPPTPPQSITPQATTTPPPPSPVQNLTSGIMENSNNDNLLEKANTNIEASHNSHKGFVARYYTNPTNEAFEQTIGESIKTYLGGNAFSVTSNSEIVDRTTGIYESPFYTATTYLTAAGGTPITDTNFKVIAPTGISDFTIYAGDTPSTITNAQQQIWYDPQREIIISKITNTAATYQEILFAGSKSRTLLDSDLLYYKNVNALFFNQSSTNLASLYDNVLVINPQNKKTLSLLMDGEAVGIGIGKLYSGTSIESKHYIVRYDTDGTIAKTNFEEMDGAIYGTSNQAVAISGISTTIEQDDSDGYTYPKSYLIANGIALKDTATYAPPSNPYANYVVLEGMTTKQLLADGSSSIQNDLAITLNKNAGTLSVASTGLNIDHTNSAYIHDNYFAVLSTATYAETPLLKDYLIAIPYNSGNDYVSWGYWGQNSYQAGNDPDMTTTTTPFSTWVAGVKTPTSVINGLISSSATYDYAGHVIGSVLESGCAGYILQDGTNAINLHVTFANAAAITGTMAFNTNLASTWNSNITGTTLNNTGFAANLSGGASGSLNGNFYGPTANSVAGSFNAVKTAGINASGSFKAIK